MSFFTCFWLLPQNEHLSRSPPSPMRAMAVDLVPSGASGAPDSSRCRLVNTVNRRHALSLDGTRHPGPMGARRINSDGLPDTIARRAGACLATTRSRPTGCGSLPCALAVREDLVDDPVLLGLLGRQDLVALDVPADLFLALVGVLSQRRLHEAADALDRGRLDLQVGHLAVGAFGGRLVDQHARVRQR